MTLPRIQRASSRSPGVASPYRQVPKTRVITVNEDQGE